MEFAWHGSTSNVVPVLKMIKEGMKRIEAKKKWLFAKREKQNLGQQNLPFFLEISYMEPGPQCTSIIKE